MVTNQHEIGHTLFEDDPGLISRALRHAGLDFPDLVKVEQLSTDLSTVEPVERRADRVLRFQAVDGREAVMVLEVQRGKKDDKPADWAYFGMTLAQRHGLPAVVVVITDSLACERWAAQCFDFGLGLGDRLAIRPLVLGPSNVDAVTDVEAARNDPIYAILSAVVHRDRQEIGAILEAVGEALPNMSEDAQPLVINYIELILGKSPLGDLWRNKVALHPDLFEGPTIRGLLDNAEAKGEAKALVKLAVARGIELTPADRERIMACLDEEVLDEWFSRALTVATAQEIFADQ